MTLNISVATPNALVAVSDRRLTHMGTGRITDERSTKMTVLTCANARMIITYNGIGRLPNGSTPADWLIELNDRRGLTGMSLEEVLQAIKEDAQARLLPYSRRARRHTFAIAAASASGTSIYSVSNYETATNNTTYPEGTDSFSISEMPSGLGRESRIMATGSTQDLSSDDFKRLRKAATAAGAKAADIKNLCVGIVQEAARHQKGLGPVGSSVLWVAAHRGDGWTWGLDVEGGTSVTELPNTISPSGVMKGIRIEAVQPQSQSLTHGMGPLLREKPCSKCGNPVPTGYKQCGSCGTPV